MLSFLFKSFLYKLFFCRLRLVKSSDMEENTGSSASRRSCHVVSCQYPGLHKNWSDLSRTARGGDVVLCSVTLFFFRRNSSEFWQTDAVAQG